MSFKSDLCTAFFVTALYSESGNIAPSDNEPLLHFTPTN